MRKVNVCARQIGLVAPRNCAELDSKPPRPLGSHFLLLHRPLTRSAGTSPRRVDHEPTTAGQGSSHAVRETGSVYAAGRRVTYRIQNNRVASNISVSPILTPRTPCPFPSSHLPRLQSLRHRQSRACQTFRLTPTHDSSRTIGMWGPSPDTRT